MTPQEAFFEAPAAHEAHPYSTPEGYFNPEYEDEWETHESTHYAQEAHPYSTSEYEDEWETHESTHYAQEAHPYSTSEYEDEWETHESTHFSQPEAHPYSTSEYEDEWETHESTHFSQPEAHPYSTSEYEDEWEDESDRFIGGWLKRRLRKFAPRVFNAVTNMIPGARVVRQLARSVLQEGEAQAAQMEAELFSSAEAEHSQAAQEAMLAEFLAAQAAESESEAEAQAFLAATLPIVIKISGAQRVLRPVMPVLTQANARMVRAIGSHPHQRQLRRLIPPINRRTAAILQAANRAGKQITPQLAVGTLATTAARMLSNPRLVQRQIKRNAVLRQRVAPPIARRAADVRANGTMPFSPSRAARSRGTVQCPSCAAQVRVNRSL